MHDLSEIKNGHPGAPSAGLGACRVLVIDDSEMVRTLIGACLEAAGIRDLAFAANGADGLALADRFDPDLVVLDILMPGMDGFEVCRCLRADPRYRRLPILVQTSLDSAEQRTAVFRAGATDVVAKPIHGPELVARVRVHLENQRLIRDLEDFRSAMTEDLALARDMQEGLMPEVVVAAAEAARLGMRLEAHFQPSAELGGDMWDFHTLDDDRVAVALADFSGHGVSAALNTFRLHTLMKQRPPATGESPACYLARLNGFLVEHLPVQQFATMIYGVIDTGRDEMTFAAAGVPSPILLRDGVAATLDGSGLPLGILDDATYVDHRIDFPEGAGLLLYSDALVETPDREGRMLDPSALAMLAVDCRGADPSPLAALLSRFQDGRHPPEDDLTLVWLTRGPRRSANRWRRHS